MYDYRAETIDNIIEAINENYPQYTEEYIAENYDEVYEELNDSLWIDDSVTGNASGSYTFNRAEAEEYVKDNMELCVEACREFGCLDNLGYKIADDEWEYLDVTIRCYILGECISEALDLI